MSSDNISLEELEIKEIYDWVDGFNLSRPKKNIARDFSDAILVAEILKSYYPEIVWIHSYPKVNSQHEKIKNWKFLRKKVLLKIAFPLKNSEIETIVCLEEFAIEKFLLRLMYYLENSDKAIKNHIQKKQKRSRINIKKNLAYKNSIKKKEPFLPPNQRKEVIYDLEQTIDILESKIDKLALLIKIKDDKINILSQQLIDKGIEL